MKLQKGLSLAAVASMLLVLRSLSVQADDGPPAKKESSHVSYTRPYLSLTRLDLQVAINRNKDVRNTIPQAIIGVLEQQVGLAEESVRLAEDGSAESAHKVAIKMAEILAKTAKEDYARGLEVNRIAPLQPLALDRLRIRSELAQLRVAYAKEIDPTSPLALIQFQMEIVREELAELNQRQLRLLDRN